MIRQVTPDGHPDAVWRPWIEQLPRTTAGVLLRRLTPQAAAPRVLVLSAHPDDETLGGGRLIAEWVRAGAEVLTVAATAGEACFDTVGHVEPDLARIRLEEWQQALAVLGARAVGCLHLPDGGLQAHAAQLTERLSTLVDELRPDVLAGTHRADPHPDHRAVGRAVDTVTATRGLSSVGWPVWLTYFAEPPGPSGLEVVECSAFAERVREAAWRCFRSQRQPVAEDITPVVPHRMTALLREQILQARLPEARAATDRPAGRDRA